MSDISNNLLEWFENNGRYFPFRWQKNPYKILIAEVLLRQTQAVQVAHLFPIIMDKYSDPQKLADADENELRALLKPLGITSRARDLINISKKLVNDYQCSLPESYDELIKLPGVGDYIASCVLTLGYMRPTPMVDVNVRRVIGRVFGDNYQIDRLYKEICPERKEETFHYAIIDLAQLICKHSKPECNRCPIANNCTFNKKENPNK